MTTRVSENGSNSIRIANKAKTKNGVRIKVVRDRLLIEGESVSYVETKINEVMSTNPNHWELTQVKESRIVEVIHSE